MKDACTDDNWISAEVDATVERAVDSMLARQRPDGHWVFELEADATIPAEYILLRHYLDEPVDALLEAKIAVYLRRIQGEHGGWPLFHAGALDVSASVKAYFALKMIGDDIDAPHMRGAREAILNHGGAERSNVFTRILLALYGVVTWRAVPILLVEVMLLPSWFPFHLNKISYWARTVIVPLLVLGALKPRARNPKGVSVRELFHNSPDALRLPEKAPHQSRLWFTFFSCVDAVLRATEAWLPRRLRDRAIKKAVAFVTERLNGDDGLGAIYPAMANSVMMFDALTFPNQHPDRVVARRSIERLLVQNDIQAYCQPCLSPVWDTALSAHALLEAGGERAERAAVNGLNWLRPLQVLDVAGDWTAQRAATRPGGWAFQYQNPYYPDLDDTAVIVMAMDRARELRSGNGFDESIERAREWVVDLQSNNGGWGAFDADNTYSYLNNIPFSDHGALLDPPTDDVTARCVSMLLQLRELDSAPVQKGVKFLLESQRPDGSWYGRWGINYVYGTWSAVCALSMATDSPDCIAAVKRACDWLQSIQNPDGGWGEAGGSYKLEYSGYEPAPSAASQTAWALMGLIAGGRVDSLCVRRGVDYLVHTQAEDGFWREDFHTATGFPRVFFLRYHGYCKYFPLWALSRYRNLRRGGGKQYGM